MDLDELQRRWQAHDRALDRALRVNARLAHELATHKVRSAMERLSAAVAIELVLNIGAVLLIGSYLGSHGRALRFALPAAALLWGALALLVASAAQLARIHGVDYGVPVVAIQQQLERVRLLRLRTAKWIVLLSPLAWTPLFIVALHALTGVDPYVALGAWLAVNLAFGVAAVPLLLWMARRRWMQSLTRHLDGRNLAAARAFLESLAAFEAEPS